MKEDRAVPIFWPTHSHHHHHRHHHHHNTTKLKATTFLCGRTHMVSLGRSGLAFLSLARSSSAFQVSSKSGRRTFLATGLVTASLSYSLATRSTTSTTCEASSSSSKDTRLSMSSITGYLNAADAAALDAELMSTPGFSLEQLMELAGLAVAEAVYQVVPPGTTDGGKPNKILLVCGPGNNGGDGLVAARHLVFFGYETICVYPKRSSKQHFVNLVHQCQDVGVEIVDEMPTTNNNLADYSAIVDAIFGFSFHGEPREPFATALQVMIAAQTELKIPVISVDVPSGWNVDEGDVTGTGFVPEVLVSLTTPKESAKNFTGRHFVGGRFLPPRMAEKYNIKMPPYPGVSQVMDITDLEPKQQQQPQGESGSSWEQEYAAYLAEKQAADEQVDSTNLDTVQPKKEESSWEAQYATHCADKEARLAEEDARKAKDDSWEAQYAADCAEKEAQLAEDDVGLK